MTDHPITDTATIARLAVAAAEAEAHRTRAITTLNAIAEHFDDLDPNDADDFAGDVWAAFINFDREIPEHAVADVFIRASRFMNENRIVTLAHEHFGDVETRIRLDDGRALVWLPHDRLVIATYQPASVFPALTVVFGESPHPIAA